MDLFSGRRPRFLRHAWLVLPCLLFARGAWAQLPSATLTGVFPAGGQRGARVELQIAGTNLDGNVALGSILSGADRLYFSHPGITATQLTREPGPFEEGPQTVPNRFVVSIAADVPSGVYEVRAWGKYGVTNTRAFVVGALPEQVLLEPNDSPEQAVPVELGSVVHGQIERQADVDLIRFHALAGQRVVVNCWSRRIDSQLRPTLIVQDAQGNELDRSARHARRDPLVDFTPQAEGDYLLAVQDATYVGRDDQSYVYRLEIGTIPYIDFVEPCVVVPGTRAMLTVFGRNLPGAEAANLLADGKPLQKLSVAVDVPAASQAQDLLATGLVEPYMAGMDGFWYRHATPQGEAPPLFLGLVDAAPTPEQEPNNKLAEDQKLTLPCNILGSFYPRRDRDGYRFEAKKDEVYWIEVTSQRLGLPTDPQLIVQQVTKNEMGEEQINELIAVDDAAMRIGNQNIEVAHDDPWYRLEVSADMTCRVLVRDNNSETHASPGNAYLLSIRPEQPDFRLVAVARSPGPNPDPNQNPPQPYGPWLRKGGSEQIDLIAYRRNGFNGGIEVRVENLPAGVVANTTTIGPGQTTAALVLQAGENVAESVTALTITGRAKIGNAEVVHAARQATLVWPGQGGQLAPRFRLCQELTLAIGGNEMAPFSVQPTEAKVWEMSRAGTLQIPVQAVRRNGFANALNLAPASVTPGINVGGLALDANTSAGMLTVALAPDAPVGDFTFHLHCTSQVSYARNPEAAAAARERRTALEKIQTDAVASANAARDAKATAERLANEAKAEEQQAKDQQQAAEKIADESAQRAQLAEEQLQAAQANADEDANNAALAEALVAARKARDEAVIASKEAVAAREAKTTLATDAIEKARLAEEARRLADQKNADAEALLNRANEAKANADRFTAERENASQPQNLNVGQASTSIAIRITAAPITVAVAAPAGALQQGTKIEVPVSITRLYGYNDAVQVGVTLPNGVDGLNIPQVSIPAGQNQVNVVIEANANATPGEHKLNLQVVVPYNGQNLIVVDRFPIAIEAVAQTSP